MANNNNEGVDNNPDNSKDSGLEKSFVGKFVSGIFNSTPLSKWFGKESTSASVVRRREDDDEYDASYVFQPPTKRAKLPTNSDHNNYSAHLFESPVTVHNASNNVNNVSSKVYGKFPEPMAGPSGVKSRKLFEKHNTSSTNTVSVNSFERQDIVNGDNDTDSEDSTSGYSSAPRLANKQQSTETTSRKETCEKITPKTRSLFTTTNDSSGRTLFAERSPQMNTSLSSRRPTFNASTFGSPNFVDKTLSTKRIMSSPFYSGHTIYGGASAYGRRFGRSTEDLTTSGRVSVQIKPVNEKPAGENATLSKTARRILSTLEQYSTPISDAKKIPVTPRKPGLISSYVGATPYLVRDRKRPSHKELQVPSVPDLLQMKQKERLQNSTETVRQIATKSKSTLNKEEYKLRTEEDNKQKHSNKMKSNVGSVRQKVQPVEPVSEVKLPKVSLPITTLPKFDFVLMPPNNNETSKNLTETNTTPNVKKSPVSTIIKTTIIVDKKETEKKTLENGKTCNYRFSEPLVISKDLKAVTAINCFKFSEPLCKKRATEKIVTFKLSEKDPKPEGLKLKNNGENADLVRSTKPATGNLIDVFRKTKETPLSPDRDKPKTDWECPTCLVTNNASNVKCRACDEPKPQVEEKEKRGFGDQFKLSSDKWECSACMVRNNNSDKNCVACTTARPSDSKPVVPSGFGDKFKPPASTWECASCMIRNKNELDSCAACGTSKPGQKSVVSNFGDKFKPSSDTWECSTCMIRNKKEVDKCVACETAREGTKTAPAPKTMTFGSNCNLASATSGQKVNTFTFGIKPEWECQTCLIKNKNELKKCAACEMPRESGGSEKKGFGDAFRMKGGEWECASCMVKNKPGVDVCVCCGVTKPGSSSEKLSEISKSEKKPVISFNFGIDKATTSQFKFGIPTTKSEVKESTTTVSTPSSFTFGVVAQPTTAASSSGFTFGINTQEKSVTTKPIVTTSETVTPTVVSNPLLKPSEKLPEKVTPAPVGFKFNVDSTSKNPVSSGEVVSSTSKTETSTAPTFTSGFGTKPPPMFQFKPPAINGDMNKLKEVPFGAETNKPNNAIFGDSNKPKEIVFGTDKNKLPSLPFGSTAKAQDSPFGSTPKPQESPFGSASKPQDSPFGTPTNQESPFGSASKPQDSPFGGNVTKPTDSPFGTANKPTPSPFGTPIDSNKPKEILFGSSTESKPQTALFGVDASKPQNTPFGVDNKPKDIIFGSKPPDGSTMFSNPTSTPTFTFNPKPVDSAPTTFPAAATATQPPSQGIFKFGTDPTQSTAPAKSTFGESTETNVSNGFGSVPKIPAFGAPQQFGSTENKPFSFGSTDPTPKSSGFPFGQEKPSTGNPIFTFGSGAPSSTPSTGFNFSVPSTGFNFGSAAKVEAQPFNAPPSGVFGAAAAGAKNGSFNFGPNANKNNQKAVFSFGANQTNQPSQPSFPTQSQAGFNFGAPAPVNAPPGGFNFSGVPPTFNFTDGSSTTAPPQRKIKKALRRTHR